MFQTFARPADKSVSKSRVNIYFFTKTLSAPTRIMEISFIAPFVPSNFNK